MGLFKNFSLFSGSSHPYLVSEIADYLHMDLGKIHLGSFPDGEIEVRVLESVRGKHVFVVQSIALNPNYYLMELLIMLDAFKRASAKSINVVMPYFGYCRQDRINKPREAITAKLVANLLETTHATRILTMDLHTKQVQGFFDIPLDNLYGRAVLLENIKGLDLKNLVVVPPDIGSIKLARSYASELGVDIAIIDKQRKDAYGITDTTLIGNVSGKDVLIADDMCSTGGTLASAANLCKEMGAKRVVVAVSHGVFAGQAIEKIEKSPIEKVYYCNTIQKTDRLEGTDKLCEVSVGPLFGKAIECVLAADSISSLFETHASN